MTRRYDGAGRPTASQRHRSGAAHPLRFQPAVRSRAMPSVATDALLEEIQDLIREREQEGVAGLADRVGPAEWAALVPRLDPSEVAVLLQWLPDEEIPQLLEELDPHEAAAI